MSPNRKRSHRGRPSKMRRAARRRALREQTLIIDFETRSPMALGTEMHRVLEIAIRRGLGPVQIIQGGDLISGGLHTNAVPDEATIKAGRDLLDEMLEHMRQIEMLTPLPPMVIDYKCNSRFTPDEIDRQLEAYKYRIDR